MLLGLLWIHRVVLLGMALGEGSVDWLAQLEALGRGDVAALGRVRRLVTGQLMRMQAYDSREGWDDLAQEVVVRVWRSHRDGKIRDYAALPGFVRTLTRNTLIDTYRKKQPDLGSEGDEAEEWAAAPESGLDPGTQLALRGALERLSPKHREVVEQIYLEGRSYEETATRLGRPRGTVNRLQREAMQQLRGWLWPGDDEKSA